MKHYIKEFMKRGLMAAGGGPVILAIIYGILGATGTAESLLPGQVCLGILTITFMAFISAGITVVYQIEQIPLLYAALIHAVVLYLDYLIMYLVNGWLLTNGIVIFTIVYILGFGLVWGIISLSLHAKTKALNTQLK